MALREILAQFGFDIDQDALNKADSGIGKLGASMKILGGIAAAVGAAVVASMPVRFALDVAETTAATDKVARSLGFATGQLLGWQRVVSAAGVDAKEAGDGLKDLAERAGDAVEGNEDYAESFRKLGVRLKGADGNLRSTNDILLDTLAGINKLDTAGQQIFFARELFGDESGEAFLRLAQQGTTEIEKQLAEYRTLQGVDFDSFVTSSKEASETLNNWRDAVDGLKNRLAGALIPTVTWLVETANRAVRSILAFIDGTAILTSGVYVLVAALGALAIAGLVAIAPFLPPILAAAAAIAAVVLVVDDLIALFTGGESAIGRVLDDLFGFGTAERFVDGTKIAVAGLIDVIKATVSFLADAFAGAAMFVVDILALGFLGEGGKILDRFAALARDIADGFRTLFGAAALAVQDAIAAISDRLAVVRDFVLEVVAEIRDAVSFVTDQVDRVTSAAEGVGDFFSGAGDAVTSLFSDEPAAAAMVARATVPVPTVTQASIQGGPVTVQVSGVQDPAEAARQAAALIRQQTEDQLRRARDFLYTR